MKPEKQTIYISGPITGVKNYKENFAKAEEKISKIAIPVNPLSLAAAVEKTIKEPKWQDYMREDLYNLVCCDAIYMLNNWEGSRGAQLEHHVANELGLKILYEGIDNF